VTAFILDRSLERVTRVVRSAMQGVAGDAADRGLGIPDVSGKLLRPMVAWALLPSALRSRPDPIFSAGALAIQMAHEASLLHDDILDDADRRRGEPTLRTCEGAGAALVVGDRYLTSAYVVAGDTGSSEFVGAFARAVERTVAGEMRQGSTRGQVLSEDAYASIIRDKSGALFGAAAVLASVVGASPVPLELGLRIGSLYQRIDDLLDYCVEIEQDKPPLQDWRQRKWTFPLGVAGVTDWTLDESDVLARLRSGPVPALLSAVGTLEARAAAIVADASHSLDDVEMLAGILDCWCRAARQGVEEELTRVGFSGSTTPMDQAS
jgi:octaprenyl-diphosphate synthase